MYHYDEEFYYESTAANSPLLPQHLGLQTRGKFQQKLAVYQFHYNYWDIRQHLSFAVMCLKAFRLRGCHFQAATNKSSLPFKTQPATQL